MSAQAFLRQHADFLGRAVSERENIPRGDAGIETAEKRSGHSLSMVAPWLQTLNSDGSSEEGERTLIGPSVTPQLMRLCERSFAAKENGLRA